MMTSYNRKFFLLFFLIALLSALVLLHDRSSYAQTDKETCVTDKCHAKMGKGKAVHSPVKDGMCTACHTVTLGPQEKKTKHPGNLTITLMQEGAALCYMCHEPKNKKKVVHAPIAGGDCTSCHDPHQSADKGMLKQPMPKVCFQCHPEGIMKQKVMHQPVVSGDCSGCHDNHQSDFSKRLVMEGNALCFGCHPNKEEAMKTKKVSHPPVVQSCVLCHNPHGSAAKAMLTSPVPELCSNCHPNETALKEKALIKHGPMTDSSTCMNCHDPHFADQARLLPMPQIDLCLGCHSAEMSTETGTIADMKTLIDNNKNGHGPVRNKDCVSCHNPHGSDYWRMLLKYYPSMFYTSYSDGKYGICFLCHSKDAFTEMRTKKTTNFRNGEKNLHFLHVNKSSKGRTCRACHEVHADSGKPKHVKETLGFGDWKMPMNFTPSSSGGTCAPGCHGEKKYTR